MSGTTVVNLRGHRDDPEFADVVYVGRAMHRGGWDLRASPLASPFRPGRDGSRQEVVERYREWLVGRPDLLALLPELRGHRLGCWRGPQACHAQVIAQMADSGAGTDSAVSDDADQGGTPADQHRAGPGDLLPGAQESSAPKLVVIGTCTDRRRPDTECINPTYAYFSCCAHDAEGSRWS
ncbi:DUF4326 domain-containing protein [Streptomyces sp. NPDC051219]|uniref:DUF4326 domain-containing protein n=1 Tax=Streptomyces sp. NPDC051219 TaxID=3155283 RepID=UPI003445D72F